MHIRCNECYVADVKQTGVLADEEHVVKEDLKMGELLSYISLIFLVLLAGVLFAALCCNYESTWGLIVTCAITAMLVTMLVVMAVISYNSSKYKFLTVYASDGDIIASFEGDFDVTVGSNGYITVESDGARYIYYNATCELVYYDE